MEWSESRAPFYEGNVRVDVRLQGCSATGAQADSDAGADLAQLIAELASAGLVSIEASDDGEPRYALTPQGQSAARSMALSGQAHALVLLGALATAPAELN